MFHCAHPVECSGVTNKSNSQTLFFARLLHLRRFQIDSSSSLSKLLFYSSTSNGTWNIQYWPFLVGKRSFLVSLWSSQERSSVRLKTFCYSCFLLTSFVWPHSLSLSNYLGKQISNPSLQSLGVRISQKCTGQLSPSCVFWPAFLAACL